MVSTSANANTNNTDTDTNTNTNTNTETGQSRNRPQITTRKPVYTRKTVYKSSGDESNINDDGAAYDENDDDWEPERGQDEDQPSVQNYRRGDINNRRIRPQSETADDSMVSRSKIMPPGCTPQIKPSTFVRQI